MQQLKSIPLNVVVDIPRVIIIFICYYFVSVNVWLNLWPYNNSNMLFFAWKYCNLHHRRSQNMMSPEEEIKASCKVLWHASYLIKSSIIIPFQVLGTKIKWETNTSLFGLRASLSGSSHSALSFNKILYSSISLIRAGISLRDVRSRWASVFHELTDISH